MNRTKEDFGIGVAVNVTRLEGDAFNHNFTGTVRGYHGDYVTVEDQDGDCWDCEVSQLEYNSDEYVH